MRIGIIGATGQVGGVMRAVLAEREFPVDELRLFASARSAGRTLPWDGREVTVEDAATADYAGLDIVLMAAGATTSREIAPKVAAAGATVIDNSSGWRRDPDVPLVVSEVNPYDLDRIPKGIVANPNCTTMAAMPVLMPLHRAAGLEAIVVSTYQAVSGSGGKGVAELDEQVRKVADGAAELTFRGDAVEFPAAQVYDVPIAFNVIPLPVHDGRRHRRDRRGAEAPPGVAEDPRHPRPRRVGPVRAGAGVHRPLAVDQRPLRATRSPRPRPATVLSGSPGVEVVEVPTPQMAAGNDPTYVGRIRADETVPGGRGLAFFCSSDNLRKGAALNAVQIAELLAAAAR